MPDEKPMNRWMGLAVALGLALGCLLVLRPFLTAILWSVILVFATWPVYRRVEAAVAGRRNWASGLMILAVVVVLIVPLALLGASLAADVASLVEMAQGLLSEGPPTPPEWVAKLPLLGPWLHGRWQGMAGSGTQLTAALAKYLAPLRDWALSGAANLGVNLLHLTLSLFIAVFLYPAGGALYIRLRSLCGQIGGRRALDLLRVAEETIKGVVYGIMGTALIQGVLVGLGLWVAGVPRVLLLGALAFIMALMPFGPALVWGPAAAWLLHQGETGWGLFLALWGLLVVGLVDNVLKPYFIGKESRLPFILVFLGTLGGAMAFGFLGLFLGPTLLAMAYTAFQAWSPPKTGPDLGGHDTPEGSG
ncbi:Predicted PurR-regulated permease PerM [Methylomagnum ishizawai]|uniref:Predicted PurR-regulated permease PerM n=2 Tax=Methylomagnum ishizawai TaxID=1760988 RepID=A0A1Y6DAS9_9GAMM|nr:Predicted PurR-regulated permease PerM [Methylomagnum ishizawai]